MKNKKIKSRWFRRFEKYLIKLQEILEKKKLKIFYILNILFIHYIRYYVTYLTDRNYLNLENEKIELRITGLENLKKMRKDRGVSENRKRNGSLIGERIVSRESNKLEELEENVFFEN